MKKRALISGSTGFIGSALSKRLLSKNWEVLPLSTKLAGSKGYSWDPVNFSFENKPTTKFDAVIHLGGYPLQPIWSKKMKALVYQSRAHGAKILTEWILSLHESVKPSVFICASAVGFYGATADYLGPAFEETDSPYQVNTFLGTVSKDTEKNCDPIIQCTRVVTPRIGLVLSPDGGILQKLKIPYLFGLGGPIGSGTQKFPWISLEDTINALEFLIDNPISGPVNLVSPTACETSQKRFATSLGAALNRPSIVPLPSVVLKTVLGKEAADSMFLASVNVEPAVLNASGFKFKDREIEECLRVMFSRNY